VLKKNLPVQIKKVQKMKLLRCWNAVSNTFGNLTGIFFFFFDCVSKEKMNI